MLLQEDLLKLLPMINEANAMSEELDKKVSWFSEMYKCSIAIVFSNWVKFNYTGIPKKGNPNTRLNISKSKV